MKSEPPLRLMGLSCGRHHRLGHKAQCEAHQEYCGPGHSGAMTSMWQYFRAAFAGTTSKRLKGGFAHSDPAVA